MNKEDKTPHVIRWIWKLSQIYGDKQVVCLTWARPSWRLHLWHYVWALANWLKLQESPNVKTNFLIADYQVLWDHLWETQRLRDSVVDMVIDWLAIGLDPNKSNFIVQSYVPEFCELFNYLTMFVPYSLATNNPTLKDEMKKIKQRSDDEANFISLWFVNYPVSQVADIMLPGWEIIPVWEDQVPHIELARKVIKRVNTMYGTDFAIPKALISEVPRLVWIDWNTIYLTSEFDEIKSQVQKMYTDPWKISIESPWNIDKHVVFLYLDIFHEDKDEVEALKKRYIAWWKDSIGDWALKKILVETLENFIAPIRERRKYYQNNIHLVIDAIERWSSNVRWDAQKMLLDLRKAMGLLDYWKEYLK